MDFSTSKGDMVAARAAAPMQCVPQHAIASAAQDCLRSVPASRPQTRESFCRFLKRRPAVYEPDLRVLEEMKPLLADQPELSKDIDRLVAALQLQGLSSEGTEPVPHLEDVQARAPAALKLMLQAHQNCNSLMSIPNLIPLLDRIMRIPLRTAEIVSKLEDLGAITVNSNSDAPMGHGITYDDDLLARLSSMRSNPRKQLSSSHWFYIEPAISNTELFNNLLKSSAHQLLDAALEDSGHGSCIALACKTRACKPSQVSRSCMIGRSQMQMTLYGKGRFRKLPLRVEADIIGLGRFEHVALAHAFERLAAQLQPRYALSFPCSRMLQDSELHALEINFECSIGFKGSSQNRIHCGSRVSVEGRDVAGLIEVEALFDLPYSKETEHVLRGCLGNDAAYDSGWFAWERIKSRSPSLRSLAHQDVMRVKHLKTKYHWHFTLFEEEYVVDDDLASYFWEGWQDSLSDRSTEIGEKHRAWRADFCKSTDKFGHVGVQRLSKRQRQQRRNQRRIRKLKSLEATLGINA